MESRTFSVLYEVQICSYAPKHILVAWRIHDVQYKFILYYMTVSQDMTVPVSIQRHRKHN